jgi:hypothetical protein
VWERFSRKLIEETALFGNVFFVFMDEHSYSEGNGGDHFASFFRRRGAVWTDWERRRADVDFVCSGTFEGEDKNGLAVRGFQTRPARPYLHLEGGPYQGEGVRTALWTFLIGGGHYFFHNDSEQETATTGIMGYDPRVPGGDMGMTRRDWLGHASRFFNEGLADPSASLRAGLDALAPHNELVTAGRAYCLAQPGVEYVAYSPSGTDFALNLTDAAGSWEGRWYDPRTGQYGPTFRQAGGGVTTFTKPDARDWALHLFVVSDA